MQGEGHVAADRKGISGSSIRISAHSLIVLIDCCNQITNVITFVFIMVQKLSSMNNSVRKLYGTNRILLYIPHDVIFGISLTFIQSQGCWSHPIR